MESRKSRMTDMLIDGTITKEVYDDKLIEITRKLHNFTEKKLLLEESIGKQKDVGKRMSELRETLKQEDILNEFDRVVLESIIDRVLVGGYDEEGNPDPYKLTFVLKGNQAKTIPNAKDNYKEQKNSEKEKKVSQMKKQLAEVVDGTEIKEITETQNLCSCENDGANDMCSSENDHTC